MKNDNLKENHKKHNKKRTKETQNALGIKNLKRRVNITISGSVWDEIENLDMESKSKFIEDLLKQEIKKHKENS